MTKDPLIKFKTTIRGTNSKGGDRFQLYLTTEEVANLITSLTSVQANPAGGKLDIHINKVTTGTGRVFDSAFAFVKPTQAATANTTGVKFIPATAEQIKERVAKVKREIA